MSVMKRFALGRAAPAAAVFMLGSCTDGLLVKPAREVPVVLALGIVPAASVAGADDDACAKANTAQVRLVQGAGAALDTTLTVSGPCTNPVTLRVPLSVGTGALNLSVVLMANNQPVFQGSSPVQIQRGQKTDAQVSVTPVAATVDAPDSLRTFTKLGDSITLTGAVLFATGDTVRGLQPVWTDDGKGIVVVGNGLARSRAEGSAVLTASYQGLTHTTRVSVRPVLASVTVVGVGDTANMYASWTRSFTAEARDSNQNRLPRSIAWASSFTRIATVDSSGLVTGLANGSTVITASAGGMSDSFTLNVGPAPVARVTIAPIAPMNPGQSQQLTATTYDAIGNVLTGRIISWASSNDRVASVGPTGLVTAYSGGTVTITATSEGVSGTTTVAVQQLVVAPGSVNVTNGFRGVVTTVNLLVTNPGLNPLSGLSLAISYPPATTFVPPPIVSSASLNSTTTPATLSLGLLWSQCGGPFTATTTVSSTTPGIAPVRVPISFTVSSPC